VKTPQPLKLVISIFFFFFQTACIFHEIFSFLSPSSSATKNSHQIATRKGLKMVSTGTDNSEDGMRFPITNMLEGDNGEAFW
jgi:hypothetical protein